MKLTTLFQILIAAVGMTSMAQAAETIPLVACPFSNVTGDAATAPASQKTIDLPSAIARQLAFYGVEGDKKPILAPRGWQCAMYQGSAGDFLSVWPHGRRLGKATPTVPFVSLSSTSMSGIHGFDTLARERRLRRKRWTEQDDAKILQQFADYGSVFPIATCRHPFPADHLTDHGENIVEFRTPPHRRGVGAGDACGGEISPLETFGFVDFTPSDENWSMVVRLPGGMSVLGKAIVDRAIRDLEAGPHRAD